MGCADVGRSAEPDSRYLSRVNELAPPETWHVYRFAGSEAPPRRRIALEPRRMKLNHLFDSLGRELRYALRGFARRPAFTFAAVLTLALGIGATTAIFSVVYSVLIKPLPYPNSDELVTGI